MISDDSKVDISRRSLGSVLGALGGAAGLAALASCVAGQATPEEVQSVRQSLSGSNFLWVDSITGSGPNLRNTPGNATTTPVIVVGGYAAADDGGGGVFYWSAAGGTDDGGTVIVPVSSGAGGVGTQGPCWVRIYSGAIDVRWFGAMPGATSANAGIAAAIAAVSHSSLPAGGIVYFPPGVFNITTSITVTGYSGLILRGAGKSATKIVPQTNLGGAPMIYFVNCVDCGVEDMRLAGYASSVPPMGVQSTYQSGSAPYGPPTRLRLRRLVIGGSDSASVVSHGVAFSCAAGYDCNNDNAMIEDVDILNFNQAAILIGHTNSENHRIIGGSIGGSSGQWGVLLFGGSFTMIGTSIGMANTGSTIFSFAAPSSAGWATCAPNSGNSTPAYFHPSTISNIIVESTGAGLIGVSSSAQAVRVFFSNSDILTGTSAWLIDFEGGKSSVASEIAFTNCTVFSGAALFSDASSVARFTSCNLELSNISYNGYLVLVGNTFYGTPALAGSGGAGQLYAHGNVIVGGAQTLW
jgi:hypothetical protein